MNLGNPIKVSANLRDSKWQLVLPSQFEYISALFSSEILMCRIQVSSLRLLSEKYSSKTITRLICWCLCLPIRFVVSQYLLGRQLTSIPLSVFSGSGILFSEAYPRPILSLSSEDSGVVGGVSARFLTNFPIWYDICHKRSSSEIFHGWGRSMMDFTL